MLLRTEYAATIAPIRGTPVGLRYDDAAHKRLKAIKDCVPVHWTCDGDDLLRSWVASEWLRRLFTAMSDMPQHTHYLNTSNPDRLLYDDFACLTKHIPCWCLGVRIDVETAKHRLRVLRHLRVPYKRVFVTAGAGGLNGADVDGFDAAILEDDNPALVERFGRCGTITRVLGGELCHNP